MNFSSHKLFIVILCFLNVQTLEAKKLISDEIANLSFDYTGPTTQVITQIPLLTENGSLSFSVKNANSAKVFDAFLDDATIKIFHKKATTSKTLRVWLTECTINIDSAKALASASNGFNNLAIDLNKMGVVAGDKIEIVTKVAAGFLPPVKIDVISSAGSKNNDDQTITFDEGLRLYLESEECRGKIIGNGEGISTLGEILDNDTRYNKERNRAYIIVDQNGELIDNYPVNIDQDDIIYVIVVGKKATIQAYTADFVGTYNPVDLQMRSFAPLDSSSFKPNVLAVFDPNEYDVLVKTRGPFTSANVLVKIKNNSSSGKVLATYTLAVNTLFHLGFGVAFNRTLLENPEYVLSPLSSTTNTISEEDGGRRNLVSINVIWYWSSTVKYLLRGNNITRGRDVLKEANFLERINPTMGFSLSNSVTDNLFAGITFEFARGGSLVGGYHFGKVKRLLDSNFDPGVTLFSGAVTDIQTTMVSKRDLFFGIILDTRILNAILKK